MSKVASDEEMEVISKAILTANTTLDKEIPTPQKQDLASLQQKIFTELQPQKTKPVVPTESKAPEVPLEENSE